MPVKSHGTIGFYCCFSIVKLCGSIKINLAKDVLPPIGYPVLSVVLPLFLPFLPNFIRTPQDCRPKIKVGLNYITKCYLLSMD